MSKTTVARLACDEPTARRLAGVLGESLDEAVCAAFADAGGAWQLAIHFRSAPDEAAVRSLARLAAGEAAAGALSFEAVAAADWVAQSLAGLLPVKAGRFVVHGAHDRLRVPGNALGIEIEAAVAFGTGHHGTTRGCLLALDALAKRRSKRPNALLRHPEVRAQRASKGDGPGRSSFEGRLRRPPQDDGENLTKRRRMRRALDLGTGSGVLAIAAAKILRGPVVATDIDHQAVAVARANARLNGVASQISVVRAAGTRARVIASGAPYDLIFANILLGPLMRLAGPITLLSARGASVVLSGLLPAQANAVLAIARAQGLVLERRIPLEGWVTLVLRKSFAKSPRL